ncbi:hypothetical protein ACIBF1_44150 [Spirillospora sp. NPDC050679]
MTSAADAAETWPVLSKLLAATGTARRSPDGGDNFPDSPRRRFAVGGQAPFEPSTVCIYAPDVQHGAVGRLLVADFDVSKATGTGAADPAAVVDADAEAFAVLIEQCGGQVVHDLSPSGGRHVYVRFARAIPFAELKAVAVALAARWVSYDPAPMLSASGQIRIAGSPYKRAPVEQPDGTFVRTGPLLGYLALTMPLAEAERVLRRPCGPRVWERLQQALAAEVAAAEPAPSLSAPVPGVWHTDADGRPWVPLRGGARPLRGRLAELAATGAWDAPHLQPDGHRYASPSEARYAVLRSLAAGGWSLPEVLAQARPGLPLAGLSPSGGTAAPGARGGAGALLGSRGPAQCRAVLTRDWEATVRETATQRALQNHAQQMHTSSVTHPPGKLSDLDPPQGSTRWPVPRMLMDSPTLSAARHQDLLRWQTAVWLAERDPVRASGWGRAALSVRLVLRALALAARLSSGDTVTAFGCRSLALASGLSWRTVADVLALLRDEPDPLVDLIQRGRDRDADRYGLRVPDAYRAAAARTAWQAGRIETAHPVWLELGAAAALVYESLPADDIRPVDLERRAALPRTTVSTALKDLGAHGLAVKGATGWRRGPAALDDVAVELHADLAHADRIQRYRQHRAEWHEFLHTIGRALPHLADTSGPAADPDRYLTAADLPDHPDDRPDDDSAREQEEVVEIPHTPADLFTADVPSAVPDPRPPHTPHTASEPPAEPPGPAEEAPPLPAPAELISAAHSALQGPAAAPGPALARTLLFARPEDRDRILREHGIDPDDDS